MGMAGSYAAKESVMDKELIAALCAEIIKRGGYRRKQVEQTFVTWRNAVRKGHKSCAAGAEGRLFSMLNQYPPLHETSMSDKDIEDIEAERWLVFFGQQHEGGDLAPSAAERELATKDMEAKRDAELIRFWRHHPWLSESKGSGHVL